MTFDAQLLRREPEPERNVRTTATLQLEQALDVVFAWLIDLEIKPRLNGKRRRISRHAVSNGTFEG
jgi:hypothetical protein